MLNVFLSFVAFAAPAAPNKFIQGGVGLLTFLAVLGIMVLVHEAGHFFMAKLCGVRVEAFAIGFGKRLFGVVRNGTDYRINALPLGGYVKMAGQDEMPSSLEASEIATVPTGLEPYNAEAERALGGDGERRLERQEALDSRSRGTGVEFTAVPRWRRMLIAIAGPAANLVLAFVILLFIDLLHYQRPEYLNGPALLDYVPAQTSAAKAGLKPGDTLLSFNGKPNPNWQDVLEESMLNMKRTVPFEALHDGLHQSGQIYIDNLDDPLDLSQKLGLVAREQNAPVGVQSIAPDTPAQRAGLRAGDKIVAIDGLHLHSVDALLAYLRDQGGKPATLTVLRGGETQTIQVTPEVGQVSADRQQYRLGFSPERPNFSVVRLPLPEAIKQAWQDNVHFSVLTVQILRGLLTHHVSAKNMSGPVGIEQQVSEAAEQGFWAVASLASAISINLAIFNLLPMPILDGGLLLFLIIESIARRDVKPIIKERVYQAAFVCIIVFFCFVMWNDLSRLIFTHRPS